MSDANPFDAPEFGASDARPLPAPPAPDPNASNPFDADEMHDPNVLRAAPPPTFMERASEHLSRDVMGFPRHITDAFNARANRSIIDRGREQGISDQPGEAGRFAGKPSQESFDKALSDLAAQQADHDRWENYPAANKPSDYIAAVLGGGIGGLIDPINLIPISRVGTAVERAATAVGAGEIAGNIGARAVEFGAFGAAADAAHQGLDMAAGYQEKFDAQRTLLAAGLGAGLGATMAGAATLIKGLRGELPGQISRSVEETLGEPRAPRPDMVDPGKVGEASTARPVAETPVEQPVKPQRHKVADEQYLITDPIFGDEGNSAIFRAIRNPETGELEGFFEVGKHHPVAKVPPAYKDLTPEEALMNMFGQGVGPKGEAASTVSKVSHPPEANGQERSIPVNDGHSIGTQFEPISPKVAESKAKFNEELKSADVDPNSFDQNVVARAEANGSDDFGAALEQSAIERAYEAPETRDIIRNAYGRFKVKEPPAESAPSLISFLRANGGVKDSGDLSRIFGRGSNHNKGRGRLITKDGMTLDDALEAAVEAGYFPGHRDRTDLTVADLLDAIKEDADGRKVYPEGMSKAEIADRRAYERTSNEMDAAEKHVRDVVKISDDHEPPPAEVWRDAASHMVFGGEKDAHRAFDRAVLDYERTQGEHEALIRATHGSGEADRGAIRARAGYDEEGRLVGSGQDVRGAGETGGASGRSERTAAGDQTLIPGVEPVTDRQRAELGAEKPLRGGNEPVTDGLFNPEAGNQGEMFLRKRGPATADSESRRLAIRDQLPGEAETAIGPKPAIADAQAREHRLNDSMKSIAAAMGRRLEMDGRMSTGALGAYKPAEGVLRIRYAGDIETFAHELGHAVDQRLSSDPATQAAWRAIRTAKPSELLALDYNSSVTGAKPSVEEGVAEFLRTFIVNPSYAQTHAPLTFDAFRAILAKQPELSNILAETARLSQVESGLAPTQVFASMIASGKRFGLEKLSKSLGEHGVIPTVKDYATAIYGGLIRENVHFDRLTQFLRDRAFEKTGKPESLTFARDPDHLYRQLPGAEQSAIGIIDKGVPLDISDPFTSPRSPSLTQAVARALNGSFSRLENDLDPLVVDLNAYLVARRARGEWDLFKAGQLRNQPVRASENETLRAISEFEAKYPQFKQSADDIFAFQRAMLQRKVDKGMISQETANAYLAKRTDHVPLYRDFGEEKAGGGAGQSGFRGLQFSDQHSFGGSTRDVKNVIRSMIEDVSRAERRIAENDVLVALDDLAQKAGELAGPVWEHVPNYEVRANSIDVAEALRSLAKQQGLSKLETDMMIADLGPMIGEDMSATVFGRTPTTPRGERVLFMYRGGERQAIKVGDNDISKHFYDLMTAMSAPEKDIFLKMIGAVNAGFQSAITHAPRFLLGTYIRDNMTRMFIPRFQGIAGRIPMAQDLVGIYSMLFDRSFYRAYMEGGGIRGGVYSHAAHEMHHDALAAATSSSGYMTRTLDQLAAEGTLSGKAAVLAKAPGEMARSAADYIGALGRRVAYKEGALAKGVAVLTTPAKMVSDALRLVEMSETASRLGGAKLTFKYLKKQGLSDAEAMAGALYESRDVLNYSSRGAWMGKAARVFPFMQAGITGADRSARGLVAEPVMAAMRAFERGGWDKLDARDQGILSAAWKNWLYIAAAAGTTQAIYYPFASNTDFYRRASQYMKDTYFMLQTGVDADGNPVGLTIHKGYDIPAAVMTTAERFAEEIRRADPIRWGKVLHGLIETVPRQFRSWSGLLEASPAIKTAFEVKSGMRLGMDGAPASPIVPDALKGKPIEQQAGAMTSEMAKWMGKQFHVSPLVVDHVINGMGGTGGQDIRDLSSAVFGNNPLMTTKDAMNRFFFGQVYRTAKNDTGAGQDIRELMARDHGSYQVQARAYRDALESDDTQEAQAIYNKADDAAKAFMLLQSSSRFKPEDRGLHPLQRSSDIAGILYPMMRDLGKQEIAVQDRSRKKGEVKEKIELTQEQARQLQAQFSGMLSEETRNGLTMVGHPGYEDFSVIDTRPRMDIIKSIDEDTYAELQKRMKAKHILPAHGVESAWPETRRRLLQDGRAARIHDLAVGAKRSPNAGRLEAVQ